MFQRMQMVLGKSPNAKAVMLQLLKCGKLTLKDIAKKINKAESTVRRVLKKLIELGIVDLIEVSRKDKKKEICHKEYFLTKIGEKIFKENFLNFSK